MSRKQPNPSQGELWEKAPELSHSGAPPPVTEPQTPPQPKPSLRVRLRSLRQTAIRSLSCIWKSLPAIARTMRSFNLWLAEKFGISPAWAQRFFEIELGFISLWGATMIQVGEYALAIVLWIILALVLISKVLDWKTIRGSSTRRAIVKSVSIVLVLFGITTLITMTNIKRGDQLWTALQNLWARHDLQVRTVVNNREYAPDQTIEGILWKPYYTELIVVLTNPTASDYTDVNVLVIPDYPVAEIKQLSNLSGVSLEDKNGITMSMTFQETLFPGNLTVWGPAKRAVLLGTNAGYKINCPRIPPTSSLRFIMAVVDFYKSGTAIPYTPGMVIPTPRLLELSDVSMELEFSTGESYWYGLPGVTKYFVPRPSPRLIHLDGTYVAAGKRRTIKRDVQDTVT